MPDGNNRRDSQADNYRLDFQCSPSVSRDFDYYERAGADLQQSVKPNRAGISVRPTILRSQRRYFAVPYPVSDMRKYPATNAKRSDGDEYIKRLMKQLRPSETYMTSRKITAAQVSDSSVYERLSLRTDCDPRTRSCLVPYCGRSFDSLQVLAWHMSYAHQDLSRTDEESSLCYLCGFQMQTAKGKNAHLTAKHRSVAFRHNAQCLEQREAVIAPGAPAAERLKREEPTMELIEVPVVESVVHVVETSQQS